MNARRRAAARAPQSDRFSLVQADAPALVHSLFAPGGLAASLPLAVLAWGPDGRILGCNAALASLFGWLEEDLPDLLVLPCIAPEMARRPAPEVFREILAGQHAIFSAYEHRTGDGRVLSCEWHNTVFHDPHGGPLIISIARDVTGQRRVERERESLHAVVAAVNADRSLDDVLLTVRNAAIEVGGFDRAGVWYVDNGFLHGAWGTSASGDLRDERQTVFPLSAWGPKTRSLVLGKKSYFIEEWATTDTPDGVLREKVPHAVLALRTGEELVGLLSVDNLFSGHPVNPDSLLPLLPLTEVAAVAIRDARILIERERYIQRQHRLAGLAAAISASTALSELLRMVRDAVVEVAGFDRAGVFLYDRANSSLIGTWGTDREGEIEDISHLRFPILPDVDQPWADIVRGTRSFFLTDDYTKQLRLTQDAPMYGVRHYTAVPMRAGQEIVGVLCVDNLLRDRPITQDDVETLMPFAQQAAVAIQNARLFQELRQAQDALVRSERLRAVGELASGVAHNINNVLTAVLGYAELIRHTEGTTGQIGHYARIIERAALDGAEIVRRVQQFARQETTTGFTPFDLAAVARDAIELTRPAWRNQAAARGAKIEVLTDLPTELPAQGMAVEIREVIVNLIKNAADAMPQGGTLTVRGRVEGGEAVLEVADTGMGMEAETARRVFEPFFTTKGAAMGTGLGLSVAWGIVTRHGGRLQVESAPGQGSLFRVRLPAAACCEEPRDRPSDGPTLEGWRVLLVEDEEIIATSVARMLTTQGASVEVADDAMEALRWLETHADACDLVLSDHGMAGMTGLEMLAQVRERYPHLRRMLISGWGAHPPGNVDTSPAERILSKPVRRHELAAALREVLDRV